MSICQYMRVCTHEYISWYTKALHFKKVQVQGLSAWSAGRFKRLISALLSAGKSLGKVFSRIYKFIRSTYDYIRVYTWLKFYIYVYTVKYEYILGYTWIKLYFSVYSSKWWYVTSTSTFTIVYQGAYGGLWSDQGVWTIPRTLPLRGRCPE
jgi:hypothetical protein